LDDEILNQTYLMIIRTVFVHLGLDVTTIGWSIEVCCEPIVTVISGHESADTHDGKTESNIGDSTTSHSQSYHG